MNDQFSVNFQGWLAEGHLQTSASAAPEPIVTPFTLEKMEAAMKSLDKLMKPHWHLISPSGEVYVAKDPMEFVKVIAAKSDYLGVSPLPPPEGQNDK